MGSLNLKGPVVIPTVRAKVAGLCSVSLIGPMKAKCIRTEFWGLRCSIDKATVLSFHINMRKCKNKTVHCSFNSPSNGSGSTARNFDEKDEDYVNSSVVEAGMFSLADSIYDDALCGQTLFLVFSFVK
ncbi:hypothetical protein HN51_048327 [Arachis hypogaea]